MTIVLVHRVKMAEVVIMELTHLLVNVCVVIKTFTAQVTSIQVAYIVAKYDKVLALHNAL